MQFAGATPQTDSVALRGVWKCASLKSSQGTLMHVDHTLKNVPL